MVKKEKKISEEEEIKERLNKSKEEREILKKVLEFLEKEGNNIKNNSKK